MHSLKHLMQQADDGRVQWRFRWVELRVRAGSVDHLPDHLKQARQHNLDSLRDYWQRGIFPRNHQHPQRIPVFIDPDGRRCAVAHLVTESGHTDVAHTISQKANFARVAAMQFPQLDSWAQANGFTRAELARIQPSYGTLVRDPVTFSMLMSVAYNYLNILGFILLVGVGSLGLQIAAMLRHVPQPRWPIWIIISGVVGAFISAMLQFNLLRTMRALFIAGRPEYGPEKLQYLTVEMLAGYGFLIGFALVGIGVLLLILRYWRTRRQPQTINQPITQP